MINGRAQANIDLSSLRHNFSLAQACPGSALTIAVVKANAYGNGLIPVVQALEDHADCFAVTDINEALTLDTLDSGKPILILQGIIDADDLIRIAQHNFQLVIHSLEQLSLLDETFNSQTSQAVEKPLTFWLKLDCGMGRLGLSPEDYVEAFQLLSSKPYTDKVIMMTHLSNTSMPDSPLNQTQLDCFTQVKNQLEQSGEKPTSSIAASAGLLGTLSKHYRFDSDWARPGIMLYGSSPFPWKESPLRADKLGLKAVMSLQSKIIAVKELKAGDNVGYCSQFICPHDMVIGIVSIGYADGYPSNAPNGTPVLINDERTSTVGRVSMDMLAIDLSKMPDTQIGDTVTLWGENPCVDEIAEKTGILSYNLFCSVNSNRVTFNYFN